ncbi:hypothetical protein BO79DRAFT_254353 [Aspergillus costaricaensis CBS 115574]|uniref:Uncharacterized protein n=1 Tax=Aspergillus costaricaensis CBS 115574 TaxID=1448317 RepID=A0ACD1IGB1_9EURO|nr:hypothetical protein BO79DRAFT_254353 [Aspergillus costaricaensis CBS 115574]RAK89605.1 hypothetical protein BO79DRAFT_254353 [Aspergillus costaricaensis CBS 115574]
MVASSINRSKLVGGGKLSSFPTSDQTTVLLWYHEPSCRDTQSSVVSPIDNGRINPGFFSSVNARETARVVSGPALSRRQPNVAQEGEGQPHRRWADFSGRAKHKSPSEPAKIGPIASIPCILSVKGPMPVSAHFLALLGLPAFTSWASSIPLLTDVGGVTKLGLSISLSSDLDFSSVSRQPGS